MPLVNNSTATDLRTLVQLGGSDPDTAAEGTIGLTIDPANPQAPQWTITVTHSGNGDNRRYFGHLVVNQGSAQGTNASHYLAAGIYETNLALDMAAYQNDPRVRPSLRPFLGYDDDRVYLHLTGPIATRNRLVEVEHCDDHRYAYQQSLAALDTALNARRRAGQVRPVHLRRRRHGQGHLGDRPGAAGGAAPHRDHPRRMGRRVPAAVRPVHPA